MALVKGEWLWGAIAIVNFLIYLPFIWALKGFARLNEYFQRKNFNRDYNENRYNLTPMEATTS